MFGKYICSLPVHNKIVSFEDNIIVSRDHNNNGNVSREDNHVQDHTVEVFL